MLQDFFVVVEDYILSVAGGADMTLETDIDFSGQQISHATLRERLQLMEVESRQVPYRLNLIRRENKAVSLLVEEVHSLRVRRLKPENVPARATLQYDIILLREFLQDLSERRK